MHGEELIVRIGIEELTLGCGKLNPNEQCFESGNKKVHKGRDKIKHADALVVYGGDPTPDRRPSGDAFLRADACYCCHADTPRCTDGAVTKSADRIRGTSHPIITWFVSIFTYYSLAI